MKKLELITLNIWGGYVHQPLLEFIQRHKATDIFCLQEVYSNAPHKISTEERPVCLNILEEIQVLLPNHRAFFRPVVDRIYGLAMLVHQNIEVLGEGAFWIHENPDYPGFGPTHPRILQWAKCQVDEKIFYVVNVHGLWNGMGKTDTPARLLQSENIQKFLKTLDAPFVLAGDFNLRPDTESLNIIKNSVKNLKDWIEISGSQSTRSTFYTKPEQFADYIFTSEGISANHFEVKSQPEDQVSDHLALFLDFSTQ